MIPTKIRATGLQGQTINQEIEPCCLITGPNMSGKTAFTNALQLGLFGYLPRLGKKGAATMQLADRDVLQIDLELFCPTSKKTSRIVRGWKRNKAGSVKAVTDLKDRSYDPAEDLQPALFDFSLFLNAKATERQSILEAVIVAADDDAIALKICDRLTPMPDEVSDGYRAVGLSSYAGVEELATEWGKASKQELDRLEKALKQLAVEIAEHPPTDYDADQHEEAKRAVADLQKSFGEATGKLDGITRARQMAPEQPDGANPTDEAINEAAVNLANLDEERDRAVKFAVANKELENQIGSLQLQVERLVKQGVIGELAGTAPTGEEFEKIRAADSQASDVLAGVTQEKLLLEQLGDRILRTLADNLKTAEGCIGCPTCGHTNASQDLTDVIKAHHQVELDQIAQQQIEVEKRIDQAIETKTAAKSACEDLDHLLISVERFARGQEVEQIQLNIARLQGDVHQIDFMPADHNAAKRGLDDLKATRHDWELYGAAKVPTELEEKVALADMQEVQEMHGNASEQLTSIETGYKKHHDALTRQKREAALEAEIVTAAAATKAHVELRGWAKQASLEDTAARLKTMLEPANTVLAGVINGKLAVVGTEIGIDEGAGIRPLQVLSGTEMTAVATAVQVALAAVSPVKTVIVDELSRLTPDKRRQLLTNLTSLVEWGGPIQSWIAIDHDRGFCEQYAKRHSPAVALTVINGWEGGAE
jgi:hypothetical protein